MNKEISETLIKSLIEQVQSATVSPFLYEPIVWTTICVGSPMGPMRLVAVPDNRRSQLQLERMCKRYGRRFIESPVN